ncbi:MAG TPA: tripartite tricarboxylate transporter substrate binding protein [Chloroflexota bacterium]|nr:tripartite tricarboxylate transporter substrate binding protein [Chloroflexota bacterium]
MKRLTLCLAVIVAMAGLVLVGCTQAQPQQEPTKAPAAATKATDPAKTAEPTKVAANSTTAPTKKIDYPAKGKSINLIVPFSAGGVGDIAARVTASMMEKDLGTSIQIVNKSGAGGQAGMTEVSLAKPDGYTVGWCAPASLISSYVDPERQAAYSRKSFAPIGINSRSTFNLVVKADSPYKTLKDFIDDAKARPDKVTVGIAAPMSSIHFVLLTMNQAWGTKLAPVSFDAAPRMTNLLGGHLDASIHQTPEVVPQLKSGNIRVLAVLDNKETRFLPGVKTAAAQGYELPNQGLMSQYQGAYVPASVPSDIVNALADSMKRTLESPDMKTKLDELYFDPQFMGPAEFGTLWDQTEVDLQRIYKEVGASKK